VEHRIKTLVRSKNCKIDQCSCGVMHISVGGTTVRIKKEAGQELRDALVHAFASMDSPDELPRPAVRLVHPGDDDDTGGTKLH
jgi:hypothetical protein